MSRDEAERLLEEDPTRCVRFFRAEDGTIWTSGSIPRPPVSMRSALAFAAGVALALLPREARARQVKKPLPPRELQMRRVVTLKSLLEGRRVTTMADLTSGSVTRVVDVVTGEKRRGGFSTGRVLVVQPPVVSGPTSGPSQK